MAYPKTHPLKALSTLDQREQQRLRKREQMKQMLLTKFLVKYGQKMENVVREEIDDLMGKDVITEAGLVQLDKRIRERSAVNNPEEQLSQR